MKQIIDVANLSKAYGNMQVFNDFSLSIESGQIVGLLGPNGCGKTTLIKIIAGLINDYKGSVLVDGQLVGIRSKSLISYLPEKTYLPDWMKAGQAIDYFADFYTDFDKQKAVELLNRFQMSSGMKIKSMSKGMQEKLQLFLVMSRRAALYLLDEPLSGVDPAARSVILDIIIDNYTENSTVLLSTHLIYDVERIFDRIVFLKYGRVEINEQAELLREQYGKSIDELFREVFRC